MEAPILTLLAGLVGVAGTFAAWHWNPKRRVYAALDEIYNELHGPGGIYEQRDVALQKDDNDTLTRTTSRTIELTNRKKALLDRIK